MIEVQNEPLSPSVYTSQIKDISHHVRLFLVWVLFIGFFTLNLFQFNFTHGPITLKYWFLALSVITVIAWLSIHRGITRKPLDPLNLDALNQLYCLLTGCILGIGVYLIHHYLMIKSDNLTILHLMIMANTMLSMVYIMGIIYLTQHFRYFLWIYIPSVLPAFCIELFFPSSIPTQYILMQDIWFVMIFMGAFISSRNHQKFDAMNSKNNEFFKQSQQHLEDSQQLQIQLQAEVTLTEAMKQELQLHNQLLEQKVQERIYDIKQINDRLENHQANLAFAHETAGITSWVWNIEKRTYEIANSNNEIEFKQLNIRPDSIEQHIHPDDLANYKFQLKQHIKGKTERFEVAYRVQKNQQWCWIQDIGKVISRNTKNQALRMVGIQRDIQKDKVAQEKLKLSSNVLAQVAEGVFILDNNLCYLEVNPFFEKLLNLKQEEVFGKHLFDLTVNQQPNMQNAFSLVTQELIQKGEYEAELNTEFISGKKLILWLHINAIYDEKNRVSNYVGLITDLTERKKQEQRLSYLEHYDLLTDLPNRFYFKQQLHNYLTHYSDAFKNFAVLRINIDRFKLFNEYLSHREGDELLKQVAQRLRLCCTNASLISYLNNDDFAVIYNLNSNSLNIHQLAQNILEAFKPPFQLKDQEHSITISIGIALYPEHGLQLDSLNGHAESALREAKNLGGNTVYFYSNKKTPLLNQGINLESELKKAIKFNDLSVNYQPKICTRTQRVYGFEALIRWKHPTLGFIAPDVFIPLAEETSLISEIGSIVLNETCKQIRVWKKHGFNNFRVSINVVAQQIYRGRLIEEIDEALAKYRLSGDMLELELTESTLIDQTKEVNDLLQQLKDRDISISLDDFGTGYSSLAYLTSYPFDVLKIDRAFISKIGNEKDEAIVIAIIAMGTAIGITMVAEGVETKEQALFLEEHGCYILQGFYFAKALTSKDSIRYLEQNKMITI